MGAKMEEEQEKRDRAWTDSAVAGELKKLEDITEEENINKPGSSFFACLLKIGAIVKGTGQPFITYDEALSRIKDACKGHSWLKDKEIERQWRNAWKFAKPRFRAS
jgi:hypothetical protein